MELLERDGPLAQLAEAWEAAARGHGCVVLVTGEPGIGKTFLVTRFAAHLEGRGRVLWGVCDDLSIPRPLGPLRDLAGAVSASLEQALTHGAAPHEIHAELLTELKMPPRPTVLVVEDVHWADEATLDAVTVVGRRIASLPAMLVLTFRDGEVTPAHPLRAVLSALASGTLHHLPLGPLSRDAVASLAGDDADEVYAATGGNPFFVTELLGTWPSDLPPSVSDAVVGRAARLDEASRRVVELASVVPTRIETRVLDAVVPDWAAAAEEPERRQLLQVTPRHVRFRHELARRAISSGLPVARRRRLHAEIVKALLAVGADPAEIVHHAEAAGDVDVVAGHALVAARRAAALASNREAYSHFLRASEFADRLPGAEQAALFEEFARASYLVDRLADAFSAIERAITANEAIGDKAAIGRCRRRLSRFHWYAGDGNAAVKAAHAAVEILEPLGESVELACAYSTLSQLAMLSARADETLEWGARAVDLAERLGDESTRAHALVNIGVVRTQLDADDTATILQAHEIAHAAGDHHEAVRALIGVAFAHIFWVRPESAQRYTDLGRAYAQEHEVDALLTYLMAMTAWLRLRAGDWEEAERLASGEVEKGITVSQLLAKTVLAELAVRRGDPDTAERLADIAQQADRTGELQRIAPVLALETQWALASGGPMPLERFARAIAIVDATPGHSAWDAAQVAAWGAVADIPMDFDGPMSSVHAAMIRHDWEGAADAFGAVGWNYDRALLLSLLNDERSLAEAIEIARRLGAEPLTARVARRMRELGHVVPRGRLESTRANPAGLTSRQLEVLRLVAEGLTNAEIADRLFVSPRTAEHHVAALLAKLKAHSRRDAVRRAADLGLLAR